MHEKRGASKMKNTYIVSSLNKTNRVPSPKLFHNGKLAIKSFVCKEAFISSLGNLIMGTHIQ